MRWGRVRDCAETTLGLLVFCEVRAGVGLGGQGLATALSISSYWTETSAGSFVCGGRRFAMDPIPGNLREMAGTGLHESHDCDQRRYSDGGSHERRSHQHEVAKAGLEQPGVIRKLL